MSIFALIFFLVSLPSFSSSESAGIEGGFEVINLDDDEELSWISNLNIGFPSSNSANQTLYFTADRGKSNVYTANFIVGGGPETFTCDGVSLFGTNTFPAYLSFIVYDTNIIGPSFTSPSFPIQNILLDTMVASYTYPNFTFVSLIVDGERGPSEGLSYTYLAGWDNKDVDAFVVARSSISLGTFQPLNPINPIADVITFTGPCFDQYDERRHPLLYLYKEYLVVLITGPCSNIIRITLPTGPWSSAPKLSFNPSGNSSYVSSATLDPDTGLTFYTSKIFNAPNAEVYTYNIATTENKIVQTLEGDMARDSELLAVVAKSKDTKWLLIIGSGSTFIERYTIQDGSLTDKTSTPLPSELSSISSTLYYDPYLFFTTYEPDAKIVRVHMDNFCSSWCSVNGYCLAGSCSCNENYIPNSDPDIVCELEKTITPKQEAAVIGLAIVFVLSLLLAIVGWILYCRSKGSYTSIKS